ncbi:MAG: STAS domain-containing protein [Alphaproteobacteria bacterium]|nr:STAS domain-containing protein [Alphaproteobacteria bacterium]
MQYEIMQTDATIEVQLQGRMEFTDHKVFRDLISQLSEPSGKNLVFNLAGLDFIDSSGLGMLIIANNVARQNRVEFRLMRPRDGVRRVLEVAKFQTIAPIDP